MAATTLPVELLREKNGMPEDEGLRGLSRLDRDRPGLVVTTVGGGCELSAVALLLADSVLERAIMLEPSLLVRPSEVDCCASELELALLASPAMSLLEAAIRFHPLAPDV